MAKPMRVFNTPALRGSGYHSRSMPRALESQAAVDTSIIAAFKKKRDEVAQTKKDAKAEYDKIRNSYITRALLQNISDDILSPDSKSGEVVKLASENDDINKALRVFQDVFSVDQFLIDNIEEILSIGDRNFFMQVGRSQSGSLEVEVYKASHQEEVVAFYDNPVFPSFFLIPDSDLALAKISPNQLLHFSVLAENLPVEVDSTTGSTPGNISRWDNYGVSEYARLGRSIFYGVFDKVRSLEILEMLPIASKLSKLATASLIGMTMPADYPVADAMEACAKYEKMLNHSGTLRELEEGELTVSDIINAAKLRVVPVFGEKGDLRPMDVNRIDPSSASLSEVDDTRRIISSTIGYPYELLFGSAGGGTHKNDVMRAMSRYIKKLIRVQRNLETGLRQMAAIWLGHYKIPFRASDIRVSFSNRLVNLEDLDKLEFSMQIMESLPRMVESLGILKDAGFPTQMDKSIAETFSSYLSSSGFDVSLDEPLKIRSAADMQREMSGEEFERNKLSKEQTRELGQLRKRFEDMEKIRAAEQAKWASVGGGGQSPFDLPQGLGGFDSSGDSIGDAYIERRNGNGSKAHSR